VQLTLICTLIWQTIKNLIKCNNNTAANDISIILWSLAQLKLLDLQFTNVSKITISNYWQPYSSKIIKSYLMQKLFKNLTKNYIITAHCNKCNTTQNVNVVCAAVILNLFHKLCNLYQIVKKWHCSLQEFSVNE